MGKFENKMRVVMAEKRVTIAEMSEALELHRNTIANLRDGTPTVRWETLEAVCNYLKCKPWDLFPWVEENKA